MFRMSPRLTPLFFCALFLASCGLRQDAVPEDITPTAAETLTTTFQIQAATDDAEEVFGGSARVGQTTLDLGVYNGLKRRVGFRFNGLTIPPGARIDSAVIELRAADSMGANTSFTVVGEASDNAATYARTLDNIGSRPVTQASVPWTPTPWVGGTTYPTAELKTILQEIVDRPGWQTGNAAAFVVTGTYTRRAAAFDAGLVEVRAPRLVVTYTTDSAPPPPPPPTNVCDTLSGTVPSPWQSADLGTVSATGKASEASGTFDLCGYGSGLGTSTDSFHFVRQTLDGDGTFTAQVTGLDASTTNAKAAVMIRASLDANANYAAVLVSAANQFAFSTRSETVSSTSLSRELSDRAKKNERGLRRGQFADVLDQVIGAPPTTERATGFFKQIKAPAFIIEPQANQLTTPYWLRLIRKGNNLTGYTSSDGQTWTLSGTATIPMAQQVYVGLVSTSQGSTIPAIARFDNVTLGPVVEEPGTVTGTVSSAIGAAVANASVTINFSETSFSKSTTTGADGSFSLTNLSTDGSFAVTAFDSATATSGTTISFITPSAPSQDVEIQLDPPTTTPEAFTNSDFSNGTLSGWTTEGDVQIVNKADAFPETLSTATLQALDTSYAAVASTAGNNQSVGRLSQSFYVEPCHTTLEGKIRFISSEWPQYYGTQYNDAYIAKLITPAGVQIIDQGNLNSSSWSDGLLGYSGKASVVNVEIDVSSFAGQNVPLTLDFQVSDVGDQVVDSAMAVGDFKLVGDTAFTTQSQGLTMQATDSVRLEDVDFQTRPVTSWVVPDDFVAAGVSTPYTFEYDDGLVVVARQSDVGGGRVTFEVPVQALSKAGNPLSFSSDKTLRFADVESQPTVITNGVARIPVTVPVATTATVAPINLDNLKVSSGGELTAQNTAQCETVVPLKFTGNPPSNGSPINKQIGNELGNDAAGWFGDLGLDWESIGVVLKFGYDLIPLVGDGTELAVQLTSYLRGKGIDETAAGLSGVGFALDFPTSPVTVAAGGVVSGSKTIYKISKAGAGTYSR